MTGNLSHQMEHHLFPDLPSNRYAEIAPRVKDIFDRYGLTYHSAPLPKQVASAWHKVHPAVAAQRLAGRDDAGERAGAGGQAGPDDDGRQEGPPGAPGRRLRKDPAALTLRRLRTSLRAGPTGEAQNPAVLGLTVQRLGSTGAPRDRASSDHPR